MKKLAIVILNWNGVDFLRRFIPAVSKHSKGDHIDLWVADNGSSDDSLEFLKKDFPGVKLLEFDRNYGFAGGYNRALSVIKAEYFILLNSDVEVTRGWTQPLLKMMESDDRIAACMPKIKDLKRRDYFEYAGAAGGFIDYLGYTFCRGRVFDMLEKDKGQYDDEREIFWATGACMMVRSVDWLDAGGLDETFFAHMEEIDLCWRFKNAGKKIMVCPSSVVYHFGGGALPQNHPRKTYLNFRNNLLMISKNLPAGKLHLVLIRLVFDWLSIIKFIASFSFANAFAVIRSHFAFFRLFPSYLQKRKVLLKKSKVVRHGEILSESIVISFFIHRRKHFYQYE